MSTSVMADTQVDGQVEFEVAEGYTITQFCDKMIDLYLNEKPKVKQWRKYLVFRDEWNKYRDSFYNRCRTWADKESDQILKERLLSLESKVRKARTIISVSFGICAVKEIMHSLYKATKRSLRIISPKEKMLNTTDPEERFSALAAVFSPGQDHETKDPKAIYITPKELHKSIKIILDAYHLNMEEADIKEAKKISQPVVMQRRFILKETIVEEYLDKSSFLAQQREEKTYSENIWSIIQILS